MQATHRALSSRRAAAALAVTAATLAGLPAIAAEPVRDNVVSFSTTATRELVQDLIQITLQARQEGAVAAEVQAQLKQQLEGALAAFHKLNPQLPAIDIALDNGFNRKVVSAPPASLVAWVADAVGETLSPQRLAPRGPLAHIHPETLGLRPPQVHTGLIASGDQFVNSADDVATLRHHLPGVLAVEMEGAAVAQVCEAFGVPYAVLRTISDRADASAHLDFERFVRSVASPYSLAIVTALLRVLPDG